MSAPLMSNQAPGADVELDPIEIHETEEDFESGYAIGPDVEFDNDNDYDIHARSGIDIKHNTDDENVSDDGDLQAFVAAPGGIWNSFKEVVFTSKMNWLLLCMPFAFASRVFSWGDAPTFVFAFLALCPLAERVSFVTEELAKYTNDTLGGLLNATMGNVTEIIVSIFALREGMLRVVQVSMLGSILSNLLLVLGCAFLFGGVRFSTQRFSKRAASANMQMLFLGVAALTLPAVLDATHQEKSDEQILTLSRITAFCLLLVYALLIFYQLSTHRHVFEGQEEDGDDDEAAVLTFWGSIAWMSIITGFISLMSEFIVDALEGAAEDLHIPVLFIAAIVLPIVGNAAEHAAAVIFAYKNKMEIAMGIAVGSGAQICLSVIPFCVVLGMIMGQPLSLDFHLFETVSLFVTVLLVGLTIQVGESDWLKGAMLVLTYVVVAASYWVHADPEDLEL